MKQTLPMLTIGQLAGQVGVRTSTLRYYEQEGLLTPDGHTDSGYRLYQPEAVQRVRLIQRAQRLGFSLADIKPLLDNWATGDLNEDAVISTAEQRFLLLEKQLTHLLVLQHELTLFLQDLHRGGDQASITGSHPFDQLLARYNDEAGGQLSAQLMFEWLLQKTGCNLATSTAQNILEQLRGQHTHIWRSEEDYHILVVSQDPAVAEALQSLAQLEADCSAHATVSTQFAYGDEGFLLQVRGENAFIFARLFLALERERASQPVQSKTHNQLQGPYA